MRTLLAVLFLGVTAIAQAQESEAALTVTAGTVETLVVKRVEPHYSPEVMKSGVSGDVVVSVEIDNTGQLRRFTFVRGPVAPRETIAKALFDWRFRPHQVNGVAVPVRSELIFPFSGEQAATDQSADVSPATANASTPGGLPVLPPQDAERMLLRRVAAQYPREAMRLRVEGNVVLKAFIGKTGKVDKIEVIRGPLQLRSAAMDAVYQWVYKPLILADQATSFTTEIEVNFKIFP